MSLFVLVTQEIAPPIKPPQIPYTAHTLRECQRLAVECNGGDAVLWRVLDDEDPSGAILFAKAINEHFWIHEIALP